MPERRPSPPPLTRILETVLYADDLEAAERFYSHILGLEVDSKKDGIFVFFRLDGAMLLLFRPERSLANDVIPPHGGSGPGHACFAMEEKELDRWKVLLVERGVEIEHEQAWPRGGRSFYFRDPAGNSLEVATPRIWSFEEG
jgi:catechol 2,3-dioxygenase-like lactoylglutathione lyase family enzyme